MKANQMFDLGGRVVVVTGAASGIGLAMTEVMAEHGAEVVMADVQAEPLAREAARLGAAGFAVHSQVVDVTDAAGIKAVVDGAAARRGRLDIVCANAGISAGPGYAAPEGTIENTSLETYGRAMRVNLDGVFLTMRAAAPHMKQAKRGSIIATASVAGLRVSGLPGHAYHTSKAGVVQLVRLVAGELAPYNVRVNGIAPGAFPTNIGGGRLRNPETQKGFVAHCPLGRVADMDEIKGLVLLLASDASSYMTGTVIPIDGGVSIR